MELLTSFEFKAGEFPEIDNVVKTLVSEGWENYHVDEYKRIGRDRIKTIVAKKYYFRRNIKP